MRRRHFVGAAAHGLGGLVAGDWAFRRLGWPAAAPYLLIPMDDSQGDHLKAYGLTYRALERGGRAEWFLNYRGGSFLVPVSYTHLTLPTNREV